MAQTLHVRSTEDFYMHVEPAYGELLASPEPEDLDVVMAPGTYRGQALQLMDYLGQGQVTVTVRAEDALNPPIFQDASVTLEGQHLRLIGLVFKQTIPPKTLVTLNSRGTIALLGCVFVANRLNDVPG